MTPLLLLSLPLLPLTHALAFPHTTTTTTTSDYHPYHYGFDVHARVKRHLTRRSAQVVQGKRVGGVVSGEIGVRQEIRQLELDKDVWTLYLLGLSMMQFTDQGVATSYYGLAGKFSPFPLCCCCWGGWRGRKGVRGKGVEQKGVG